LNAKSRALIDHAREELRACNLLLEGELFSQVASRAYLAMLHASEALMANDGIDYSSEAGLHAAFGQLLLKFGGEDPRFHGHIFTTFRQRQAADRRSPTEVSLQRAEEVLAQAREFVEMAEAYLSKKGDAGA
jgi:uncharacterized protein (UPF0332 family)